MAQVQYFSTTSPLEVRPYDDADEADVLRLLAASMGWVPDEQSTAFFRWKHRDNPFGPSPAWVAVDGEAVVGYRVFLRWEFVRAGEVVRAVRAVDTATHPDYQGQGIFSRLTLHALEHLAEDGVAFVFNTPNDKSRPGYLKMGWQPVGKLPVWARPRSLLALPRVARARVPAEKWSLPGGAGQAAPDVLADGDAVGRLLARSGASRGLSTHRTLDYLRWRFGFGPLAYRAAVGPGGVAEGVALYRRRRRGSAVEAAITEVLVPDGDRRRRSELLRSVLRGSGADYAVRIGRRGAGFVPVSRPRPLLVWRSVTAAHAPPLPEWDLTLGDIELF